MLFDGFARATEMRRILEEVVTINFIRFNKIIIYRHFSIYDSFQRICRWISRNRNLVGAEPLAFPSIVFFRAVHSRISGVAMVARKCVLSMYPPFISVRSVSFVSFLISLWHLRNLFSFGCAVLKRIIICRQVNGAESSDNHRSRNNIMNGQIPQIPKSH